jgi:prophage regulatory protein
MPPDRSHYPLAEAAELAKCKPSDLLHFGVQKQISLLVGVPDWVDLRVYDDSTRSDFEPFLLAPQLLVLLQTHCLKIELSGRTEQSDFREGYLLESSGKLKKILPSYGYPELNHQWVYWRTFQNDLSYLMELTTDKLFVLHSDLIQLMEPKTNKGDSGKAKPEKPKKNTRDIQGERIKPCSPEVPELATENTVTRGDPTVKQMPKRNERDNDTKESVTKKPEILRMEDVVSRVKLSKSTIYDKINPKSPRYDPTFPKKRSLGPNSVGWQESEINSWIEGRNGIVDR